MHKRAFNTKALAGATTLGLAGAGIAYSASDALFSILKDRYMALNAPTWQMQGQARLLGENADTYSFVKGREALYKGMYDIPLSVAEKEAKEFVDNVEDLAGGMYDDYRTQQSFNKIVNTPEVEALGKAKAKILFDQLSGVAPGVVRKAPGVALSAIQTAIASDSLAIRPEMIYNLARAENS